VLLVFGVPGKGSAGHAATVLIIMIIELLLLRLLRICICSFMSSLQALPLSDEQQGPLVLATHGHGGVVVQIFLLTRRLPVVLLLVL
jgi:hypothetical protein